MGEPGSSNVEIRGVKQTIQALHEFAPSIEDKLDATIKDALDVTRQGAQSRYPKGSWLINRNKKKLLGYIAARAGGKRAARWGDSAPGIRAAIFEFAGHNQAGATPQARGMIASLNARYGAPGRFLWDSWDATGKGVLSRIAESVRMAERELQARLDAAGEAY